jgi:hypothetical protein
LAQRSEIKPDRKNLRRAVKRVRGKRFEANHNHPIGLFRKIGLKNPGPAEGLKPHLLVVEK